MGTALFFDVKSLFMFRESFDLNVDRIVDIKIRLSGVNTKRPVYSGRGQHFFSSDLWNQLVFHVISSINGCPFVGGAGKLLTYKMIA